MLHLRFISQMHSAATSPSDTPSIYQRWALFLGPFIFLLVLCYFFPKQNFESQLQKNICMSYSRGHYRWICITLIILLGVIGLISALYNLWTFKAWLLYAASNLTFTLFLYLRQHRSKGMIFLNAIIGAIQVAILQFLIIQALKHDTNNKTAIIIFCIAVVQIYSVNLSLLQFSEGFAKDTRYQRMYDYDYITDKYLGQANPCSGFIVFSIALTIGLALVNKQKGCTSFEQAGYWVGQGVLTIHSCLSFFSHGW